MGEYSFCTPLKKNKPILPAGNKKSAVVSCTFDNCNRSVKAIMFCLLLQV
ncbi:MAG: hypothetical protein JWO03_3308 [Bacteroidetes bacterium]|nr:hypothetical protein [Bacteroidota bacterium]